MTRASVVFWIALLLIAALLRLYIQPDVVMKLSAVTFWSATIVTVALFVHFVREPRR